MYVRDKSSNRRGFSIIELVFVSFLVSMIFLGLVMSITQMGYSQTKSERLFTADMLVSRLLETANQKPYDTLSEAPRTEKFSLNGYEFAAKTEISDLGPPLSAKRVSVTLSWQDRNGMHTHARALVRAKPR